MLDLHMHSTASDGTDTPELLVDKCSKLGLQVFSVTDHDTIDGQYKAKELAKQKKRPYITGIEFSVRHDGELHILGYGVDINNEAFKKEMESLKEYRIARVYAIMEGLEKVGIKISFEDIVKHAKGNTIGRPHIALALIEKGYAENLQDAFVKYLNEDGAAYVKRRKLNASQAIGLIEDAGGIAVLAHPKFVKTNDIEGLVKELKSQGLKGIEAMYPAHSDADVSKYCDIAKRNGLIITAGSDYHGKMREYSAIASEKRTSPLLEKSVKKLMELYV